MFLRHLQRIYTPNGRTLYPEISKLQCLIITHFFQSISLNFLFLQKWHHSQFINLETIICIFQADIILYLQQCLPPVVCPQACHILNCCDLIFRHAVTPNFRCHFPTVFGSYQPDASLTLLPTHLTKCNTLLQPHNHS